MASEAKIELLGHFIVTHLSHNGVTSLCHWPFDMSVWVERGDIEFSNNSNIEWIKKLVPKTDSSCHINSKWADVSNRNIKQFTDSPPYNTPRDFWYPCWCFQRYEVKNLSDFSFNF